MSIDPDLLEIQYEAAWRNSKWSLPPVGKQGGVNVRLYGLCYEWNQGNNPATLQASLDKAYLETTEPLRQIVSAATMSSKAAELILLRDFESLNRLLDPTDILRYCEQNNFSHLNQLKYNDLERILSLRLCIVKQIACKFEKSMDRLGPTEPVKWASTLLQMTCQYCAISRQHGRPQFALNACERLESLERLDPNRSFLMQYEKAKTVWSMGEKLSVRFGSDDLPLFS